MNMTKQEELAKKQFATPGLKTFWISFWVSIDLIDTFECHFPWWISGQSEDEMASVVAYILAKNEQDAYEFIQQCFDANTSVEWRFCDQKISTYSDRFKKPTWAIDPNDYGVKND